MTNEIRVAIYARTAVCPDAEGIKRQINLCRDEATRHGWQIAGVFEEEGMSGTDDRRPGLDALRQAVRQRLCDVVLVEDAARIARQQDMIVGFGLFARDHGVDIWTLSGRYKLYPTAGPSDPCDSFRL